MGTEQMEPPAIFQSIFGESWERLPPVFRAHYANRPFSDDETIVRGTMYVRLSLLYRLASPLFHLTKTLVPKSGDNVEVTVKFCSEPDSNLFRFEREFAFPDGQRYQFVSRMEPVGGNEVIEWTESGIGWHAAFSYDNGKVHLKHIGYWLDVFGKRVKLPLSWLFGKAEAEEEMIDADSFRMAMRIRSPVFGEVYGYGGTFKLSERKS